MSSARYHQPPHPPLYPSLSPDSQKIVFTAVLSPQRGDRGIFTVNADGSGLETVFDVPGAHDSAPAWSPDGAASPSRATPTSTAQTGVLDGSVVPRHVHES